MVTVLRVRGETMAACRRRAVAWDGGDLSGWAEHQQAFLVWREVLRLADGLEHACVRDCSFVCPTLGRRSWSHHDEAVVTRLRAQAVA